MSEEETKIEEPKIEEPKIEETREDRLLKRGTYLPEDIEFVKKRFRYDQKLIDYVKN